MALDGILNGTRSPPPYVTVSLFVLFIAALSLALTRFFTTARFYKTLHQWSSEPRSPPRLPYTIPFLGQALDFLAPKPGVFWHNVFAKYTTLREAGTCSLRLANQRAHVIFTPTAVQALFKAPLTRHKFSQQLVVNALGLSAAEGFQYWGHGESPNADGLTPVQQQEKLNYDYLVKTQRVNELTAHFIRVLRDTLADDQADLAETELYAWIRSRMFKASTDAFMGTKLLEMFPDFERDFFEFDRGFLTTFFGIPRAFARKEYAVRDNILDQVEEWQRQTQIAVNGQPADPEGPVDWEPDFGSRANRARQIYYAGRKLSLRARAGMDLGFMFGASSNAIPATGWMLMRILDPAGDPTLYPRVMAELRTVERPDGTVDVARLVALPLLTSAFHEVLRLYVDVLVTREINTDLVLPLAEGKDARRVLLERGSLLFAPSWLGHRDPGLWSSPPSDVFCADRFLRDDPETGKQVFTTAGTQGKFFPFGGGKTVCPGRVFAKQEVLGAVAYVLLNFDFDVKGYVGEKGEEKVRFPGLREGFTGSGIMVMDGDLRVSVTRKPAKESR